MQVPQLILLIFVRISCPQSTRILIKEPVGGPPAATTRSLSSDVLEPQLHDRRNGALFVPGAVVGSEELESHFETIDKVSTEEFPDGVRACKECKVRPYYNETKLQVQRRAAVLLYKLATRQPGEEDALDVSVINQLLQEHKVTYQAIEVQLGDRVNNRDVFVLREVAGVTCNPSKKRGKEGLPPCTFNGALMVAANAYDGGRAQHLGIESPHPRFDMYTGRQGYTLFVRLNARFWMVNTAQRKHKLAYETGYEHGWGACDNPDGTGWGGTHDVAVTDPAHSPKSLLHTWHTALVDEGYAHQEPFFIAQNHGFGAKTQSYCKCDYQVSDGLGDPGDDWTDELHMVDAAVAVLESYTFPPVPEDAEGVAAYPWKSRSCYGVGWPLNETTGKADPEGVVCAKMNPQGQYINLYDREHNRGPQQYNDSAQECTLADEGPGRVVGLFLHIEQSSRARQINEKTPQVWEGFARAIQAAYDYAAEHVESSLRAQGEAANES